MKNGCGTCSMCCKIMQIREISKPRHVWCPHVVKGKGCGIYADRPASCRAFQCVWLQSQETSMPMGLELRPDKTRVMLNINKQGNVLVAECDPGYPDAWRAEPIHSVLTNFVAKSKFRVLVRSARDYMLSRINDTEVSKREVKLSAPDENDEQHYFGESPSLRMGPRSKYDHTRGEDQSSREKGP